MNSENVKLLLAIERRAKSIPYPREEREDGTNHGFKDLKSNPSAIHEVAEIRDCSSLRDALMAINDPDTQFFTVGCEKSLNEHKGKYWKKGFIEFSFNHPELVRDAGSYFPLFFHFHQALPTAEFLSQHSIQFCWELQGCRFRKVGVEGFTCCVWITTGDYPTADESEDVWDEGVRLIGKYLARFKFASLPPSPPIYALPH